MSETSGPFDPVDPENPVGGEILAEADWELMLQTLVDGVPGVPGASILAATVSGASVRGVDIAAGRSLVRSRWYKSNAVITKASPANGTGAARIDRAVLRLNRTTNTITNELLEGTAGSGQPPAITDNDTVTEQLLWRWTVQPGATVASGLVDERQWLGRPPRPCTSTNRPINPLKGDLAPEVDTGNVIKFDGTTWDVISEDTGWATLTLNGKDKAFWQVQMPLKYRRLNGVVWLGFRVLRLGSTLRTSDADGSQIAVLPTGFRPDANAPQILGMGNHSRNYLQLFIEPTGEVKIYPMGEDLPANRSVYAYAHFPVG